LRVFTPAKEIRRKKIIVPDLKFIISDPDPQIENHEFRIRIRILLLLEMVRKKW
jgi:hypothetical protein